MRRRAPAAPAHDPGARGEELRDSGRHRFGSVGAVDHQERVALQDFEAARAAALDEEFPPFLWKVVVGALGDKKLEDILGRLSGIAGDIYAVTAPSSRGIPAAVVAEAARRALPDHTVHESGSVDDGLTAALDAAGVDGAVLVTGSMYVAGEARSLLSKTERS